MWPFKRDCKCHEELKAIHDELTEITRLLKSIVPTSKPFESYTIVQNSKGETMKQKLVSPPGGTVGGTSNFTAIGTPAGGSPTLPITFASSNPADAISIDTTDPSGLSINVVWGGPAGISTLTVTDGSGATGSLAVPVSAGPPPPPTAFTSYTFVQNS